MMIASILCILALSGGGRAAASCPEPVIANGGFTSESYTYKTRSVVSYFCDDGYDLSPPRVTSSTCRKKGYDFVWRPAVPSCIKRDYVAITCDVPPQPADGSYTPVAEAYGVDDAITYSCDYGFYLDPADSDTRVCTSYGTWDIDAPSCIRTTCPARLGPNNGGVKPEKDSYNVGDAITFYCDEGYRLEGAPDDYCTVSGEWQYNQYVSCVKQCAMPVDYEFGGGTYAPKQLSYDEGDVITFSCGKGYCLRGSEQSTCVDGSWDPDSFPVCLPQCSRPSVTNGGILVQDKDAFCPGEYVRYYCDKGYSNTGAKVGRCNQYGGWNGEAVCKPVKKKKCPKPVIEDGGVDPDQEWYHPRATVDFYCKSGCKLVGAFSATCKGNGKWNTNIPTCDCTPPPYQPLCIDLDCGVFDHNAYHCQCDFDCWRRGNCCADFRDVCFGYEIGLPFV